MQKDSPLQMIPFAPPVEEYDEAGGYADGDTDDGETLSFDTLREAFRRTASDNAATESEDEDSEDVAAEDGGVEDDGDATEIDSVRCREVSLSPRVILEAMLFVGDRENRSLTAERAAELMRNVTVDDVQAAAGELEASYRAAGSPYTIVEDGGGYRLALHRDFETLRSKLSGKVREATLSQKAIDTLAVVAYRQPVVAEDVDKLRKEPSSAVLSQLVRRGLVEQVKEKRQAKRVVVYRTTERFLKLFGLATLSDLPQTDEIDFR